MTIYHLYVKTHNKTGLKYLGKTKRNPFLYKGSGKYWLTHCKVHGFDVKTEILLETTDKNLILEKGIFYSKLWNIVKSTEWANLKEESGDGGSNGPPSIETRNKLSKSNNGKIPWIKGRKHSKDACCKMSESHKGKPSNFKGRAHSTESKDKISKSKLGQIGTFCGKKHSEETLDKMRGSHVGKHSGKKNSQYGTCWITNGIENKKISKLSVIPINWYKGRKL